MTNKIYYFDSSSTSKTYKEVLELNSKILNEHYANSDALYTSGIAVFRIQEKARQLIAEFLSVKKEEVIFTSGASLSNNLAIKGLALANIKTEKKHIITTVYEHASVLNAYKQLEELFGFEIDYLKPNKDGFIELDELKRKLRKNTLLVSVMAVNNEVGYINQIDVLAKYIKQHSEAYFHSDITQAITKIPLNLKDVDLISFSGHKIGGLKGSGVLIKRQHIKIEPLISAGQQEFGLNGGTSNYAHNICLAKALQISFKKMEEIINKITELSDYLKTELAKIKEIRIISNDYCIKNIVMIETNVYSEVMMNSLDNANIYVSYKSTCKTRDDKISPTALAMGYKGDYCIRISLDYYHDLKDIDYLVENIKRSCKKYGV